MFWSLEDLGRCRALTHHRLKFSQFHCIFRNCWQNIGLNLNPAQFENQWPYFWNPGSTPFCQIHEIVRDVHPTPLVQFLSLPCSFQQKNCQIICWHPPPAECAPILLWEILDPPLLTFGTGSRVDSCFRRWRGGTAGGSGTRTSTRRSRWTDSCSSWWSRRTAGRPAPGSGSYTRRTPCSTPCLQKRTSQITQLSFT